MKKGMYCVIGDSRLSAPRTVDRTWFASEASAVRHAQLLAVPTGGTLFVVCVTRVVEVDDLTTQSKKRAWRRDNLGQKGT